MGLIRVRGVLRKNASSFRNVFLLDVFLLSVRLGGVQMNFSPRALDRMSAFDSVTNL